MALDLRGPRPVLHRVPVEWGVRQGFGYLVLNGPFVFGECTLRHTKELPRLRSTLTTRRRCLVRHRLLRRWLLLLLLLLIWHLLLLLVGHLLLLLLWDLGSTSKSNPRRGLCLRH